jgi:hypothetical protein
VSDPEPEAPKPLPRRPPRTLLVHFAVDSAVTFLLVVVVALFLGAPIIPIAIGAVVVGALLAPWTRRRELDALARRPDPGEPRGGPPG